VTSARRAAASSVAAADGKNPHRLGLSWIVVSSFEAVAAREKIIKIISALGQSMSYPLFQDDAMKRYKTHYPRRSLLSVPYSVRPDRIERGLRILRALRFSIAAAAAPVSRPQQREFDFILSRGA
jgi:hypothetical protein